MLPIVHIVIFYPACSLRDETVIGTAVSQQLVFDTGICRDAERKHGPDALLALDADGATV